MDELQKELDTLNSNFTQMATKFDSNITMVTENLNNVYQRLRTTFESDLVITPFTGEGESMDFETWLENVNLLWGPPFKR